MIACGALALVLSGGLSGLLGAVFVGVLLLAWRLESSRWQLSERVGLVVVLFSLPLFYLDWRFLAGAGVAQEKVGVSALAHLILFLSSVKLLQIKADRDWVFLYLISFFEILLSAGLSISPMFLATLSLYLLCALSTIVAFEMRKARRSVEVTETRLLVAPDSTLMRRLMRRGPRAQKAEVRRLPVVAGVMLFLIFVLALPLFFVTPRTGASALTRGDGGLSGFVGFSDRVELGAIGRLQQSNEVVMRVRVEEPQGGSGRNLRWRGVALDQFDGLRWQKSRAANLDIQPTGDKGFFQLGTTEGLHRLTTQTFFVEPIDTPVLFAAPRVVALQAALPYVRLDKEGALSTHPHTQDRLSYKVYSDTEEPDAEALRADAEAYPRGFRYLLLPARLDPRIAELAREVTLRAKATNRYDAARAIEDYLQHEFGYTLDLKAGGPDPLADFLFNVREGHCEYFSTAMAVMLRTQGIASRVVNGFQRGEYNDTADVYTVTQRDAHSWVEVYFPESNSWVTFDPTPAAGRPVRESTGLLAQARKYAEAVELLWMQYVVGYDKQEQRSLATSVRGHLGSLRRALAEKFESLKAALSELWSGAPGETGPQGPWMKIIALLIFVPFIVVPLWLTRRVWRLGFRRGLKLWRREREGRSVVEFYERLTKVLAARGLRRAPDQTPLEFAAATNLSEAMQITRAYNRVRYGEQQLSTGEAEEVDRWLREMESGKT
ncbi:MAG: protein-glutamine gamma-glutamyltransferase [Blastocatellia bacterium]|jgi:transglutaminase-like putative cysteine protease|nr:protein-glutamine gamma-glutamyltransferase [Blastocatellia bacterium]